MKSPFYEQETDISNQLNEKYQFFIKNIEKQISIYAKFFQLKEPTLLKGKADHYFGIELLLSRNSNLIINSFEMFTKGYSYTAIAILRMIGEGVLFALLFVSTPDDYYEYEKLEYFKFKKFLKDKYKKTENNYFDLLLKIIDEKHSFAEGEDRDKYSFLKTMQYLKELHNFIHPNTQNYYKFIYNNDSTPEKIKMNFGPFLPPKELCDKYFTKLYHLILKNVMVLEKILPQNETITGLFYESKVLMSEFLKKNKG